MILTWICSVESFSNESDNASIEPSTSPLTITFNSLKFPIAKRRPISSSVICFWVRNPCSRCNCNLLLATWRASTSLSITLNLSPDVGAPCIPSTWTGVDGPAWSNLTPRSLCKALTLPLYPPASMASPTFSVPDCINTVVTIPRPLSNAASITVPTARLLGLAVNSSISASKQTFSSKRSIPSPVLPEISWLWYFPPHSSTRIFMAESCSRILSALEPGLSTLLKANTMGTFAACAWLIASRVWGITLSSAAITIIAISVTFAPLARIAVKASWPGVSKNVIFLSFSRLTS